MAPLAVAQCGLCPQSDLPTLTWYQPHTRSSASADRAPRPRLFFLAPPPLSARVPLTTRPPTRRPALLSLAMADDEIAPDPTAALAAALAAVLPAAAPSNPAASLATINIKTHLPITLELHPPNYRAWRELFTTLLGKFGAGHHIDGTPVPNPVTPVWTTTDFSVRSLLYSSISPKLMNKVMTPGANARTIWLAIEAQFQNNKSSRALALEADFRNLAQGNLSFSDYSERLKSYADGLADLGFPVNEPTLVLTLIRGLSPTLRHMGTLIKSRDPLPTFSTACSMLELEEADLKTPQPGEHTALVVAPQPPAPQPPASPSAPQQFSSAPRNNNKNRYKNKNRNSAPSSGRSGASGGFGGFRPFLNPYTGTFQMWPMQPTQGVLGPRPGVPHQAMFAGAPPGFPTAGAPTAAATTSATNT